jgi:hypothetical protein
MAQGGHCPIHGICWCIYTIELNLCITEESNQNLSESQNAQWET